MKKLLPWLIVGLIIRLVIMAVTVHPDIRAFALGNYFIAFQGQVLSFYDGLISLDPGSLLLKNYNLDFFIYPPLAYLVPAFFAFILKPLYDPAFNWQFLVDMGQTYQQADLFRYLLLLKLPYLIFDFLMAGLLFKLFRQQGGEKKGLLAAKLWLLNPVTLYATLAMGQVEIFPTLLTAAAILFALKEKKELSVLMLGLGGAFKLFPLLLLPIFILAMEEKPLRMVKLVVLGVLPYLAVIAPYYLFSPMYRESAFLAEHTQKMFYMNLPVSGGEGLPVFALGYFALFYLAVKYRGQKQFFWLAGLGMLLLFFSVTHYHPQWFLWLTPFLIWLLVECKQKYLVQIGLLLISYVFIVSCFEPSLHIGLFAPLNPQLLQAQSMTEVLKPIYDPLVLKSLVRSLFAVTSLFLMVDLLPSGKK